ncbi:MAG TPA: EamA family transporter [Candidatus Limnocylindrales bacterium]|nr:EamA family transporter [Candidatus Limnocylindrales bacterium]
MPTSKRTTPAPRAMVWLAILILYVVWGSTYLGIRIAVESIPPFTMGSTRFLIAGVVMLAVIAVVRRGSIARPTRTQLRDSFIVGALLMGGGMGAVAWGEQTVPSGIAALLIAMMPVWVAIFSRVFLHERLPLAAMLGIGVGMAGVAILVGPSIAVDGSLDPAGIVALLISPISWAAGSVFAAHRAKLPEDPFVATGFQMLSGAAVLGALAIATGEIFTVRLEAITQESLVALAYLTLVGSLVAFTAYVWVLRHAPLPLIATYAFVNPVVAVVLGAIVLNETVTPLQVVAGAVIVVGVALIIVSRSRMSGAQDESSPEPVRARDADEVPTAA